MKSTRMREGNYKWYLNNNCFTALKIKQGRWLLFIQKVGMDMEYITECNTLKDCKEYSKGVA